jgi:DNA uptake protein ComE-like DNA-binding protein
MMILTKPRYQLAVDAAEQQGLAQLAAACDEPGQLPVPAAVPTPQDASPGVPHPSPLPEPGPPKLTPAGCGDGQIDLNTADEAELAGIIHIDPARAAEVARHRPWPNLEELVRIDGLGPARVADGEPRLERVPPHHVVHAA